MRLLIVSPYFPPQRGAASVRLWSIAQQAVSAGHETEVLTITKEPDQIGDWSESFDGSVYEIQPQTPGYLNKLRAQDLRQRTPSGTNGSGVTKSSPIHSVLGAIRTRSGVYSSVRMPDLTDHWVGPAIEWAQQHQQVHGPWDAVISSSGPYTAHLVAMHLKQSGWTNHWIADFRDLWTANHAFNGLFPWTLRERKLEERVLSRADTITTVSPPLARWLSQRTSAPVEVIYNGYGDINLDSITLNKHSFADQIQLVYTGQLYPKHQDASAILAAMKSASGSEINISLTIAGASSEAWHRLARRMGVQSLLTHLGEISHQHALDLQRHADALIAFEWADTSAGVLTNKLFEYIAAGPPVLITGRAGPMSKLIHETGRGIHLGQHPEQVTRTLRSFLSAEHKTPEPNLELIQSLSRENQSKKLIGLCEQFDALVS
ncbi:MAG: glycosyltransferase [Phycisphaerales bacterium]|nr:glycosyltransferase [Phycisphaerales bacterium]